MSHKNVEVRAKSFLEFLSEAVDTNATASQEETAQKEAGQEDSKQADLNPVPSPAAALAPELESIPLPNNTEDDSVATPESPTPVIPVIPTQEPNTAPTSSHKTVILNGYVSNIGDVHPNKVITEQIAETNSDAVEEINLYELNIMSVDTNTGGKEPADGMTKIYKAIDEAAVLIISAEVKNGQISGVLQTCLERIVQHYTSQELRNKVLGTVITGKEESHVSTRSSIINFAMSMGMIVGGDCNIYAVSDDTLGVHAPADVTSFITCVNELVKATESIRQTIQTNSIGNESPFMSYSDFDKQMDDVPHVDEVEDELPNHTEDDSNIEEFTSHFKEEEPELPEESSKEVDEPNEEEEEEDIMSYDKFTLDK